MVYVKICGRNENTKMRRPGSFLEDSILGEIQCLAGLGSLTLLCVTVPRDQESPLLHSSSLWSSLAYSWKASLEPGIGTEQSGITLAKPTEGYKGQCMGFIADSIGENRDGEGLHN